MSSDVLEIAQSNLSDQVKSDILYAHDNIRRFTKAQKETISECALEVQAENLD